MIKIEGSHVAVTMALAAFAVAAWAVSRPLPQTVPSESARISPPDDPRLEAEGAREPLDTEQHDGGERDPSDEREPAQTPARRGVDS